MLRRKSAFSGAVRFLSIAATVVLANCAHTTPTQTSSTGLIGYVTDASGNVVRSGTGSCVRTGSWEPQYAIKECDPDLVAQAAPPPVATAPAETQAPAAPEPEVAQAQPAAATPREPVRIFVGVDTYFAFDHADLTLDAQHKLDLILERARNVENPSIRIVGFADPIGSPDYNLSLSQRRADAVRTYFIEQGVPENELSVDARGEADPIVNCEGREGSSLIDCFQPNRRTEIEFSALQSPG